MSTWLTAKTCYQTPDITQHVSQQSGMRSLSRSFPRTTLSLVATEANTEGLLCAEGFISIILTSTPGVELKGQSQDLHPSSLNQKRIQNSEPLHYAIYSCLCQGLLAHSDVLLGNCAEGRGSTFSFCRKITTSPSFKP